MRNSKKILITLSLTLFAFYHNATCSDYYWVGGTGNWSNYAMHWVTASGGSVFHIQPPTPNDNVYFDVNSFATAGDTVYLDSTIINCNTMDWSLVTNSPVVQGINQWYNNSITVYGSFILNANMKWNQNGEIFLLSSLAGTIINTNGLALSDSLFYSTLKINGSGSFDLMNDINVNLIYINNGIFNSHDNTINASIYIVSGMVINPPIILLGVSIINGGIVFHVLGTAIDADSTTINCTEFSSYLPVAFNIVSSTKFITANNCTFNSLLCPAIYGGSNSINEVQFIDLSGQYFYNQASNYINGDSNYFHKAIVPCSFFEITGNQTFDSLLFTNPGQFVKINNSIISINNDLEIAGTCSGLATISSPYTSTISISTGTFNYNYLYLQNIILSGGAICSLNNSIDGGGNSGWIINSPSPRTLYWVGGQGIWTDASHWSISSGGSGGACVPNHFDSLFFDVNSFPTTGDTVFANVSFLYCKNMDWTGVANAPVFTSSAYDPQLTIEGSFILNPNLTFKYDGSVYLTSSTSYNIINTYGLNPSANFGQFYLNLDGSGSYFLQNDLLATSIYFKTGTFVSNNFNLTGSVYTSYYANNLTVYFGTSLISNGTYDFSYGATVVIHADSATFHVNNFNSSSGVAYNNVTCAGITSDSCSFADVHCYGISGTGNSFQKVVFDSLNYSTLSGANNHIHYAIASSKSFYYGNFNATASYTFDSLLFASTGLTINFYNGSSMSINNYLEINGSCSGLTSLICNSGSATIHKTGSFTSDYLLLQNIHATGGSFIANNTIDLGGNTGWTINSPPPQNLYWVGGTGNWNDISHWSTISGGAGGACLPNLFDDVFFDANSFPTIGDTVYVVFYPITFHSMNWSGVTNMPRFYNYGTTLNIYGSFILSPNMYLTYDAGTVFKSNSTGNIINTYGIPLTSSNPWAPIYFQGSGSWDLASDLTTDELRFQNGTFRSNNYTVTAWDINNSSQPINPEVYFGTSVINGGEIEFDYGNLILHADSCTIYANDLSYSSQPTIFNTVICQDGLGANSCSFNHVECGRVSGNDNVFSDFYFTDYSGCSISGTNNIFHSVIVPANQCGISGLNTFDTLIFNNPGQTIGLNGTITVNNYLQIESSPGFPTSIEGTLGNATISKPTDTVCTDFIYLININATGGAVFYAGDNSFDMGNNTGWNFSSCTPAISNVWPGDANYDLITDNLDLLYIGLAYNDTGFVRPAASLNYIAQPCTDWNYQFANGSNLKHADTDGNGFVNANDTLAVSLNYGQTHPAKMSDSLQTNLFGADLYFQMPPGVLNIGDTVSIPILFGTANFQAANIYGIAFTIEYDAGLVEPSTMRIDFDNSWIANTGNFIHLEKDFSSSGKFEVGYSRIDHTDAAGFGVIATLHFVVANNAGGMQFNLAFSHVKVLSHFEIEIPVNPLPAAGITGIDDSNSGFDFYIAPNPMNNISKIVFNNSGNTLFVIRMTDVTGRRVQPEQITTTNELWIERKNLTPGIYFVTLLNQKTKTAATRKLIIQ